MRPSLSASLLAVFAAISISACSKSSTSSNNSAEQTPAASASIADNMSNDNGAAPAAPTTAPPVYPGAAQSAKPKGVADGAPPEATAYSTTDDLAKVRAWYKVALKGAPELGAPDNDKTKDAFIVGQGKTGMVVILQSVGGKTWIIIGPVRLERS